MRRLAHGHPPAPGADPAKPDGDSPWRAAARASNVPATFAHAITSTRPTASIVPVTIQASMRSASGWSRVSAVGRRVTRRSCWSGDARREDAPRRHRRWRAPVRRRSGASSRALTKSHRWPRRSMRDEPVGDGTISLIPAGSISSAKRTGTQISGASMGTMPVNVSSSTPTTVNSCPRMRSVRPMAEASPPNSRFQ